MANALAASPSPYLRQHAENPVAWQPWGEEAFAEARRRGVPVLVSIGYSTCHWCHVMAHECFEDAATAELMNRTLVCIKVDREEHPEVDDIYMDAVQLLTGHGGWPLNAFTDHTGRPFHACTYVPRPSWQRLLTHLDQVWRTDRPRLDEACAELTAHLQPPAPTPGSLDDGILALLDKQLERTFDAEHPAWAWNPERAPKFPSSQLIPLLLDLGRATQAEAVLEAMQDAGIHDRVGGGFHRYSVDREWRVPHFEKMLYDNAQLMGAYARAALRLGRADFLQTAVNIGDYLLRDERITVDGVFAGYAAAEDADDPGGEGSFYAWSPEQLAAVLGAAEGARLAAEWDLHPGQREIGRSGHDEPVTHHVPQPRAAGIPAGVAGQAHRARWEAFLPRLRAVRDARPRPGRDDKVLTDQNGLALEGFAWLGRATGEPRFIAATRELADAMVARHTATGLLRLAYRPAYITDYGFLAAGLMAAFDLLGDPTLVDRAAAIIDEAVARLRSDDGGFFTTPAGRADLVRRSREQLDNAWPAGQNSLAVAAMRLHAITGAARWREVAEGIIADGASACRRAPTASATLLAAWRQARDEPRTAVVVGSTLLAAARRHPDPAVPIIPLDTCRGRDWPALAGRQDLSGEQVLVCTGTACLAPARTVDEVAARLM